MKTYLIFAAVSAAFIFGAYWAGAQIAGNQCRAEFATKQADSIIQTNSQIIKTKRKIDEETYSTGVADIRVRLREKYTIRD